MAQEPNENPTEWQPGAGDGGQQAETPETHSTDPSDLEQAVQACSPETPAAELARICKAIAAVEQDDLVRELIGKLSEASMKPPHVLLQLSTPLQERMEHILKAEGAAEAKAIAEEIGKLDPKGQYTADDLAPLVKRIAALADSVAADKLTALLAKKSGTNKRIVAKMVADAKGVVQKKNARGNAVLGAAVTSFPDGAAVYADGHYAVNAQGVWRYAPLPENPDQERWVLTIPHPIHPEAVLVKAENQNDEVGMLVRVGDQQKTLPIRTIASKSPAQDLAAALDIMLIPKTGQALQEFLGVVAGALPRRPVVNEIGWNAERRLVLPGQETLVMGPAAKEPYGKTAGDEAEARKIWQDIVFHILRKHAPAVLLVLGHAYASVLREPLRLSTGALHLGGDSSTGKSIATELAMALCGPPDKLVRDYDTSKAGPERLAATARHYPIALDEPRTARGTDPKERVRLLFKLVSGRSAVRSDIHFGVREQEMWRLSVLTNGESGMVVGAGETGTWRRAGEWSVTDVPLWDDPIKTGVTVLEAAKEVYGWPLVWGAAGPLGAVWDDPPARQRMIAKAAVELREAVGADGVLHDFAITLALAYHGASLLGQALDPHGELGSLYTDWWTKVQQPLWDVAKAVLKSFHERLQEAGGSSVGMRLAHELMSLYVARSHDFIRRRHGATGRAAIIGAEPEEESARPPREYAGIVWVDDDGNAIEVGYFPKTVKEAAKQMDLADPRTAMRALVRMGIAVTDAHSSTEKAIKYKGATVRVFVIAVNKLGWEGLDGGADDAIAPEKEDRF